MGALGDVMLVVHVSSPTVSRAAYAETGWRRRLAEEIDRAITYKRSLGVIAIIGLDPSGVAQLSNALRLIDVRPAEERALATAPVPFDTLDHGIEALQALPKDTPLAFLCHHGGRSQQAAEHFRGLGFREVYNVVGPICESADHFGHERLLPPTEEGDVLLIANAGAYGRVMGSCYNLREPAGEVLV